MVRSKGPVASDNPVGLRIKVWLFDRGLSVANVFPKRTSPEVIDRLMGLDFNVESAQQIVADMKAVDNFITAMGIQTGKRAKAMVRSIVRIVVEVWLSRDF